MLSLTVFSKLHALAVRNHFFHSRKLWKWNLEDRISKKYILRIQSQLFDFHVSRQIKFHNFILPSLSSLFHLVSSFSSSIYTRAIEKAATIVRREYFVKSFHFFSAFSWATIYFHLARDKGRKTRQRWLTE